MDVRRSGRWLVTLLVAAVVAASDAAGAAEVRRFEWVVSLRTTTDVADALGRAELAAGAAGGAVLEHVRMDSGAGFVDYRMLVRTLDRDAIGPVLARMRTARGVVGVTATPLPETPTWAGGPGFMESYTADLDGQAPNAGRVLMRHDVPPIADKRELLEAADMVVGPGLPSSDPLLDPSGMAAGGVSVNVSELFKRLRESSWRRREDKLRSTPIVILPPDGSAVPVNEPGS